MNFSRPDFASQNKQATTSSGTGLSKQDILQPRLRVITGVDNFPTPSVQSTTLPTRENFNQADNRYRESRSVDSRSQAKSSSKAAVDQGLPQYFGSTFTHVPNAPNRPLLIPPKSPAYAAPYSPLAKQEFAASPLQNQRSSDGSIIGSPSKRFVQEHHVPFWSPDEPLGPDNPVKVLNDTWTACWDDEAGAIYYYNQLSGEATWLPPVL